MNLESEKTKPSRESERGGEISAVYVQHAFADQLHPHTVPILREIKIKMKDSVHTLDGFTFSPEEQEHKRVFSSLVLQR